MYHRLFQKLTEWLARYLPSEVLGTLGAVLAGWLTYQLTTSAVLSALAGTWGENLGFYGYAFFREWREARPSIAKTTPEVKPSASRVLFSSVKTILLEHGPAELLDSFVCRPFLMWFCQIYFANTALGLLIGKLGADAVFYALSILSYEIRKSLPRS